MVLVLVLVSALGAASFRVLILTNKFPFRTTFPIKWNFMGDVNYKKIHKWRFIITIMFTISNTISFSFLYECLPFTNLIYFENNFFDQLVCSNGIVTRFFECEATKFGSTSFRHNSGKSLHVLNNSNIIVLE